MLWYNISFAKISLLIGTVSHVSDVAHGRLVISAVVVVGGGVYES